MTEKNQTEKEKLHCSFCGKEQDAVHRLVAGPGVYICDECIELCNEIIDEDSSDDKDDIYSRDLAKPAEIKGMLDEHVIGQELAKKALAVAVYNHYKRIRYNRGKNKKTDLEKSNILLIGPTGSGKTLLARTLANFLQVPFAIVDATTLTEAGYVGEDVENILLRLIQNADGDTKRAETGIIYIDEIDKIARKKDSPSITRDVSGEGVQQALLKIIEGTIANVPTQGGRKHPHQDFIQLDTRNILFICGGAFIGLDKIIEYRLGKRQIGFGREGQPIASIEETAEVTPVATTKKKKTSRKSKKTKLLKLSSPKNDRQEIAEKLPNESNLSGGNSQTNIAKANERRAYFFQNIQTRDFIRYGLIPEFIGRMPVVTILNDLDVHMLRRIFTEPRNSLLQQFTQNFAIEKVKLNFADDAITRIAEKAIERESGSRGLRGVLEQIMLDLMYEIPSEKGVEEIIINKNVIDKNEKPVIIYKKSSNKSEKYKKKRI